MMLLIDVGNTRIKWAIHDAGRLGPQLAEAHAGWSVSDVHRHMTGQAGVPERLVVSNVGGPRVAALLTEAAQTWGIRPIFVQAGAEAAGVRNAYAEPAKLGVDRWLALIASHAMVAGAACVASIGTAMTIDGIDAHGQHLGGLITPGPQMMVKSLLHGTSDIAARSGTPQSSATVLANDTATAVHNGARHALAALIVRAADWVRLQVDQPPAVILTGGASPQVADLLPWGCQCVPDLVLRGLALIASEV
jgi:type III pantothenate kinase